MTREVELAAPGEVVWESVPKEVRDGRNRLLGRANGSSKALAQEKAGGEDQALESQETIPTRSKFTPYFFPNERNKSGILQVIYFML